MIELTDMTDGYPDRISRRKQKYELENGRIINVVNVGNEKLDIQINPSEVNDFYIRINGEQVEEIPLTIVFDNRSYPELVRDGFTSLFTKDDPHSKAVAITRFFGALGNAFLEDHTVYVSTQEIAIFETLGIMSLNAVLGHELTHLGDIQEDYSEINKNQRNKIAIILSTLGYSIASFSVGSALASLSSTAQIELEKIGVGLISAFAAKVAHDRYYQDPDEKRARSGENIAKQEFQLITYSQPTLTERSLNRLFRKRND